MCPLYSLGLVDRARPPEQSGCKNWTTIKNLTILILPKPPSRNKFRPESSSRPFQILPQQVWPASQRLVGRAELSVHLPPLAPPAESSSGTKIFLRKRLSHKGYPLYGQNYFRIG